MTSTCTRVPVVAAQLLAEARFRFCSRPDAISYHTIIEHLVPTPLYDWSSGDRFYACPSCRTYVDTKDWDGPIGYADLGVLGTQVVRAFAKNYAPGAVAFTPGTNPESGR
ncbi:hypothetical protein ACIO3O_41905 [Streptomyces sp. NPDC087440]|uniref:hypothetical protein n=1 Tax=Streptomyces sp. NPDC087440 TaxID=3365790 RepID=UPI00381FD54C